VNATYHVLYVDDEPGLLEIGKLFLEQSGQLSVDTSDSAIKALTLLNAKRYDALVSDYMMPGMDGIAFLKAIRERFGDLPFILFTGRGREEIVINAINNGADFYLQKGSDAAAQFAELAHKIRQAVRRREAEQELRRSESRLRSFIETTRESVSIVDEEGKVKEWNAATEQITGIRKEEALGSFLWDLTFRLLPPEYHTEERRAFIEQRIRTSLKTGIPVFQEPQIIEAEAADGARIYTRQTIFPIRMDKGFGIGSISQDITREKLAENAIRESEKKYHDLAELLPQMVFELDRDFRVLWANQHAQKTLGLTQQEIDRGINARSFIVPTGLDTAQGDVEKLFSGMPLGTREFAAVRKDKSSFPVLVYSAPVYRNEKLCGFRGVAVDISERKKMEDALRISEDKYRGITERSSDCILVLNKEMSPTYVSPSVRQMLGYAPEELVGKTLEFAMETIFSEAGPAFMQAVTATRSGLPVENVELQLCRKDKTPVIVNLFALPILRNGILEGAQVSMRDITEIVVTQSALKAIVGSMVRTTGLNSLWKIAENVSSWLGADCVMVGEIQPDRDTVKVLSMILEGKQVKDFIYHLKGTPCENVAEKGFCHYPDDSVRLFPNAKDIIELNIQGYVGTPLRDSRGEVSGILCALSRKPVQLSPSVREILEIIAVKAAAEVERIRIEGELRQSEEKFRSFVENANEIMFSLSPDGIFTYVSPNCTDWLGHDTSEVIGKPAADLIHPDDFPKNREDFLETLRTGKRISGTEFRIRHKDGSWRWNSQSISPIRNPEGTIIGIQGISHDITDRKQAEEALRKANDKLNLLSSITRHDINNQLLTLNGFIALLQHDITDPTQKKYFSRIAQASSNIAEMIRFTSEYEKVGTGDPAWQDLAKVIAAAGKGFIPDQFILINDLPAPTEVFADPMLEKVFFNLLDNAARHGGRVTQIRVASRPSGEDLVIVWEDNGIGIAADHKEHIFDRGFGKNTGLGMFLVREILSLTGISIVETGEPGNGARFEMTVPKGAFRFVKS